MPRTPINVWLQRGMWVVVLGVGLYLLLPRLADLREALRLLPQARRGPVLWALAFEVVTLLAQAWVVQRIAERTGVHLVFGRLLEIVLAAGVAILLLPSLGISGLLIRARYFDEDGASADTAMLTLGLESLGLGVAYSLLLVPALLQELSRGHDAPWEPALLLMGLVALASVGLAHLLSRRRTQDWRYNWLEQLNVWLVRLRRPKVDMARLEQRLTVLYQALPLHSATEGLGWLLANMVRVAGAVLCLYSVLASFGQRLPLHIVLIAYILADVAGWMTTVPAGLVANETALAALLAQAGVPLATAMAVVVLFRLVSMWLPRVLGVGAWMHLQRQSRRSLW
jgi:uncharacterized protein (TIRG00374 family)